jgi:hypothetical protein
MAWLADEVVVAYRRMAGCPPAKPKSSLHLKTKRGGTNVSLFSNLGTTLRLSRPKKQRCWRTIVGVFLEMETMNDVCANTPSLKLVYMGFKEGTTPGLFF